MREQLKRVKMTQPSGNEIKREPYERDQLDLYASRIKWCPYLSSMMLFLLTCAGRSQDIYDVDPLKL